jgi:release factor glutamine methyltransferase
VSTIASLLGSAAGRLDSDTARLDAQLILAHVLGCTKTLLYAWPDREVAESAVLEFEQLVNKRRQGVPIAYLLNHREFFGLDFYVDQSVLIPRPETEFMVEAVLQLELPSEVRLLDLGLGSGAIALTLGSLRPQWRVFGAEASEPALKVAKRNAKTLLDRAVDFRLSDWFSAFEGERFDVIVSNPPYVEPDSDYLKEGDVRFEPRQALTADKQGKADLMCIASQSREFLSDAGWLFLEHGWAQGMNVRDMLQRAGFQNIRTIKDLQGLDRITCGQSI